MTAGSVLTPRSARELTRPERRSTGIVILCAVLLAGLGLWTIIFDLWNYLGWLMVLAFGILAAAAAIHAVGADA
jgi:hypothetical protein